MDKREIKVNKWWYWTKTCLLMHFIVPKYLGSDIAYAFGVLSVCCFVAFFYYRIKDWVESIPQRKRI